MTIESMSNKHAFICKNCNKMFNAQQANNLLFGKGITFPKGDLSVVRTQCPHCNKIYDYSQEDILKPLEQVNEENKQSFDKSSRKLENKIEDLTTHLKDLEQTIKNKDEQISELLRSNTKLADAVAKLTEKLDNAILSPKTKFDPKNPLTG